MQTNMNYERRMKELGLPRVEKEVMPLAWEWQRHEDFGHTTDRSAKDYQMAEVTSVNYLKVEADEEGYLPEEKFLESTQKGDCECGACESHL